MSAANKGSSIARSSAIMAAGTLASRILGLVRNSLLIAAVGATASGAGEAFNDANNLPTQLYGLMIGGVPPSLFRRSCRRCGSATARSSSTVC